MFIVNMEEHNGGLSGDFVFLGEGAPACIAGCFASLQYSFL